MTDEIHDVLDQAGRRWRATQPDPPEPDRSRWEPGRSAPRLPRRGPLVAVAGSTLVAVGLITTIATPWAWWPWRSDRGGEGQVVVTAAAPTPAPAEVLLVREGDIVQASGTVLAEPGRAVRFCAPAVTFMPARPSVDPRIPDCTYSVPVTGVDPNHLAMTAVPPGVWFGKARLRGVWRAGTLHVTQQAAPDPENLSMLSDNTSDDASDDPPCPAPAGGWPVTEPADGKALHQYMEEEHADQFRRPRVSYPGRRADGKATGGGAGGGSTPGAGAVEVLVIEVVKGDVEAARKALRERYSGNLCVVSRPGALSLADERARHGAVQATLGTLMRDGANGIYSSGYDPEREVVEVELVMVTPQLYEHFTRIGLDMLRLNPWLRPMR